jgi:hypothetical protein
LVILSEHNAVSDDHREQDREQCPMSYRSLQKESAMRNMYCGRHMAISPMRDYRFVAVAVNSRGRMIGKRRHILRYGGSIARKGLQ